MTRQLTSQSTVNDFQWRLDVSITLRLAESDADIRTNGQWESAKCSRRAFNPVNTRRRLLRVPPRYYSQWRNIRNTIQPPRLFLTHRKYSVTPAGWLMARMCEWRLFANLPPKPIPMQRGFFENSPPFVSSSKFHQTSMFLTNRQALKFRCASIFRLAQGWSESARREIQLCHSSLPAAFSRFDPRFRPPPLSLSL